jgi:hypothetical protein
MTVINYTVTDEETAAVDAVIAPFRQQINDTPALTSLLYDVDLLPEQIKLYANAKRMIAICILFKQLTPEQVERAMRNE